MRQVNNDTERSKIMGQTIRQKVEKEIATNTPEHNDMLYRLLWKEHVKEDVLGQLEQNPDIGEHFDGNDIADAVAERYCFEGDYDCNLDYWSNLDNLINSVMYGY